MVGTKIYPLANVRDLRNSRFWPKSPKRPAAKLKKPLPDFIPVHVVKGPPTA